MMELFRLSPREKHCKGTRFHSMNYQAPYVTISKKTIFQTERIGDSFVTFKRRTPNKRRAKNVNTTDNVNKGTPLKKTYGISGINPNTKNARNVARPVR